MSLSKLCMVLLLVISFSANGSSEYQFKHFNLSPDFNNISHRQGSIFKKLEELIRDQGYKALNAAIKAITLQRRNLNVGEHHFPGLFWSAGVSANLEVGFERKVVPSLEGEGWLVKDRAVFGIGAQLYLRYLRDQGEIEIGDEQLRLFAGIFFKKEYSFDHRAVTYIDGLTKNLDKLLTSYKMFKEVNFLNLEEGEAVSKQDYMSADIGMRVKTPSIYWMRIKGGATVYFSKLNHLSYLMQRNSLDRSIDFKVSHEKTKVKGTRLQLELQLDFFNLVNLTLFGAEYSYSIAKGSSHSYLFSELQSQTIPTDPALIDAFEKLHKGKTPTEIKALAEYEISSEESIRIGESASLYSFIWGRFWGNMSEEIVYKSQHGERYLYRYQQERVAFNRSLLKFFMSPKSLNSYKTREIENLLFEFESPIKKQNSEMKSLPIESALSFKLSKEFSSKRKSESDKKKVLHLIKSFEEIDGGVIQGVESGEFHPPYFLDIHAQVSKKGIFEILRRTPYELARVYGYICTGDWVEIGQRLNRREKNCIDKFGSYYRTILSEYYFHQKLSLFHLKAFLGHLSQATSSFRPLKHLFGEDNVQLFGHFKASKFNTFHKEGAFQGYGVVRDILTRP